MIEEENILVMGKHEKIMFYLYKRKDRVEP